MITGNTLTAYKRRLLIHLDERLGEEVRQSYLKADLELDFRQVVKLDDLTQVLNGLKEDGFATRRVTEFDGVKWRITAEGRAAVAKMEPEDE